MFELSPATVALEGLILQPQVTAVKPLALGWALGAVILCGRQSGSVAGPDPPLTAEAD